MKKIYNKVLIFGMVGILFFIIFKALYIIFPIPISKFKMEEKFNKHNELLVEIANYFEKQNFYSIYITSNYEIGEMYVKKNNMEMGITIKITDTTMLDNLSVLFKKYHYNLIEKNNNGLYFQRYANKDYGRGVVYSIDGKRPQNEFLTKLEALNKANWYFYEEK